MFESLRAVDVDVCFVGTFHAATSGCAGSVLEVYDLAQGTATADLHNICRDLISSGAKLHVLPPGGAGDNQGGQQDFSVVATFENDSLAQKALASHSSSQYKLRLPSRQWDPSALDAPS